MDRIIDKRTLFPEPSSEPREKPSTSRSAGTLIFCVGMPSAPAKSTRLADQPSQSAHPQLRASTRAGASQILVRGQIIGSIIIRTD
jgi:hypothetical protein